MKKRLAQWLCKLLGGHYWGPGYWVHRFNMLDTDFVHYVEVCSRCNADRPRLLELTAELQAQLHVPCGYC